MIVVKARGASGQATRRANPAILIGLGANLPGPAGLEPQRTLDAALRRLPEFGVRIVRRSSWYESAPVPPSDQPRYVNAVASVATRLPPKGLLDALLRVESELGRTRSTRNAARTIDLDLLAYGDAVVEEADLMVPHPRMAERAFVLAPLAEIAPRWRHPRNGLTASDMLARLPAGGGVRRIGGTRAALGRTSRAPE